MTARPPRLDRPRSGVRVASADELALWRSVTRDATPFGRDSSAGARMLPKSIRPRPVHATAPLPLGLDPAKRRDPASPPVDALSERTPGLDRKTANALRRGERLPEARCDLHGMTLDRAHSTLTRFILAQRANGARCVLVITGKGGDYRDRAGGRYNMEAGGALRRDVPRWLREPPLAQTVVGIYQAHRRHGGEGALYVYLRKAR